MRICDYEASLIRKSESGRRVYPSAVNKIKGGGSGMKVEVMVDKDSTHFSYMFECDKVIDGSRLRAEDSQGQKLALLKRREQPKRAMTKEEVEALARSEFETVAVFNIWTFWQKLTDDAEQCAYCGRHDTITDKTRKYCKKCAEKHKD
jgi:hypothetical protein